MSEKNRGSIMQEIRKVEEAISVCYERVYQLEAKINNKNITSERKEKLMQELSEVEKLLATNKTILKNMRKSNRTTFMVAVGIGLIIFILWMILELV